MQIKIANFKGIKTVDFLLNKLTIIAGENYMGKSCIAHALGSVVTGAVTIFEGIPKAKANLIVRTGEKQSMMTGINL